MAPTAPTCRTPGCRREARRSGSDSLTLHAHCAECEERELRTWLGRAPSEALGPDIAHDRRVLPDRRRDRFALPGEGLGRRATDAPAAEAPMH